MNVPNDDLPTAYQPSDRFFALHFIQINIQTDKHIQTSFYKILNASTVLQNG